MASNRKVKLVNGNVYHVFTRSIAGYKIFNNEYEYERFKELLFLTRFENFKEKYSNYIRLSDNSQSELINGLKSDNKLIVSIIAYCIMPTHIHLILEQVVNNGIESFVGRVLNSYSKYFNLRHKRFGPLWSSRFKNVLVEDDEQLLHLTRYIHLNPTSAGLESSPKRWGYSSYNEYLNAERYICNYEELLDIDPESYKKFVEDRKSYQRDISLIKSIMIDDYTG